MKTTRVIPDDPALPGLVAIRSADVAGTMRRLGLGDTPVDLALCGYSTGSRATLEARTSKGHMAIKCYAKDPAPEAELYEALAGAGLTDSEAGVQVPPLLAWDRDLRILVLGWLDGPTAQSLLATGEGRRAGAVAARWIRCAASLALKLGTEFGVDRFLHRARKWATSLGEADDSLGISAAALVERLALTQERGGASHLVNGRLYARHVMDLRGATGVIDWSRFGHGPLEIDAGMFLATTWRSGKHDESRAGQASLAEGEFLAGIVGLLDERRLAWHRAAALLNLARHSMVRRDGDWLAHGQSLLREAASVIEVIGRTGPASRRRKSSEPSIADAVGADISTGEPPWRAAVAAAGASTKGWVARLHGPPVIQAGDSGRPAPSPPAHLAVMQVLRTAGQVSADELRRGLEPAPSRAAFAALMDGLERDGVVTRRTVDRRTVYRAAVEPRKIRRRVTADFASLADQLFEGDMAAAVCQLVQVRDLNANDVARVIALLEARKQEMEREKP